MTALPIPTYLAPIIAADPALAHAWRALDDYDETPRDRTVLQQFQRPKFDKADLARRKALALDYAHTHPGFSVWELSLACESSPATVNDWLKRWHAIQTGQRPGRTVHAHPVLLWTLPAGGDHR